MLQLRPPRSLLLLLLLLLLLVETLPPERPSLRPRLGVHMGLEVSVRERAAAAAVGGCTLKAREAERGEHVFFVVVVGAHARVPLELNKKAAPVEHKSPPSPSLWFVCVKHGSKVSKQQHAGSSSSSSPGVFVFFLVLFV
jgi:hypothetical protein